jgi:hypothetical protein
MAQQVMLPFEWRGIAKPIPEEDVKAGKYQTLNEPLKNLSLEQGRQRFKAERFERLVIDFYTNDPDKPAFIIQFIKTLDGKMVTQPKEGYILHFDYPEPIEIDDVLSGFSVIEGDVTVIIRAIALATPTLSI